MRMVATNTTALPPLYLKPLREHDADHEAWHVTNIICALKPRGVDSIGLDPPSKYGVNERTVPHGLFDCFNTTDCGLRCCCAQCCCGPCTWQNAMQLSPLDGYARARVDAITRKRIVAGTLSGSDSEQVRALGQGVGFVTAFESARVRLELFEKLGIFSYETYGRAAFAHACCLLCATVQEVDAVLVWQRSKGRRLYYGPLLGCNCCSFVDENYNEIRTTAPGVVVQLKMER